MNTFLPKKTDVEGRRHQNIEIARSSGTKVEENLKPSSNRTQKPKVKTQFIFLCVFSSSSKILV